MDEQFRVVMLVVALCLICSVSIGTGATVADPDPDRLLTKAVTSLETEPVEAVQIQEIHSADGEVTQTVAVHKEATNKGYLEILNSTGKRGTQQVVLEGSTVWRQGGDTTLRYKNVEWFEELRTIGARREVVADRFDGTYKGTTRLEGHEVHVIALTPPDKSKAALSLDITAGDVDYEIPIHEASERTTYLSRETWWIDTETYYPLRQTVEWTDQSGNVIATATKEYEELILGGEENSSADGTVNGALITSEKYDASASNIESFDAINPSAEDTETDTADNGSDPSESIVLEPETYTNRRPVNESVPFAFPNIEVPTGYDLDRGAVHSHDGSHTALLFYKAQTTDVTLSVQISNEEATLFQAGQTLYERDIGGVNGTLVVTETGTEAVRHCEQTTIRISGLSDRETLVDITESIECQ